MRKFLTKYLLPFLVVAFLLLLSIGCATKGHLSASIERYDYASSTGNVDVHILVRNDGQRDVGRYDIHYKITYDSSAYEDSTRGLNLNAGEKRTEYAITLIGTGKTVKDVSVTDVEWKAQ
ncbi:hypothetical protein GTN42_05365 [bacterium]|nr:hypothetical protein [bacterium]NIO18857.1 hypothetical protein [bacterium]